jgi:sugar phosphate isomerase/epimerase
MSEATFALSAFGDEIAVDLDEQLQLLNKLKVGYLDLRSAWGKNVLHMDDDDVARVREVLAAHDVQVGCIGSPIGKSPIVDPIEKELDNLARICQIGEALDCLRVRMFSFYPPDTSTNEHYDEYVEEATSRLVRLAELAEQEGATLLLENEKDIVGDTLARCHALVTAVDSPHLRFLWDPANFVQVGEERVTERGWPMLGEYIGYVHIKDAHHDGGVVAAGEGDGQVKELLTELKDSEYQGILALEPHLAFAGHSTGFSGESGMVYAVEALRKLMAEVGCVEAGGK